VIQSSSFKGVEELDRVECTFIPFLLCVGAERVMKLLNQNSSIIGLNDLIDCYHIFISTEFAAVS